MVDILSFGLLGPSTPGSDPTRELRLAIKKHCEELLPEAIGLSDGFGFTDWELDRLVRNLTLHGMHTKGRCIWTVLSGSTTETYMRACGRGCNQSH